MWDLPGPGLEPVSPALAGGFLTTVPPGEPQTFCQGMQGAQRMQGRGLRGEQGLSGQYLEMQAQGPDSALRAVGSHHVGHAGSDL